MEVRRLALSGVKWTSLANLLSAALQLAFSIALARLLPGIELGLVELVMTVLGFSMLFLDTGVSNIILNRQQISKPEVAGLWWLSVGMGVMMAGIVCITAPFLADYYNQPKLTAYLIYGSLTFIIIPFGRLPRALLQKNFKFRTIAKIEVVSMLLTFPIGFWGIWDGWGAYAYVGYLLANYSIITVLFLVFGRYYYTPAGKTTWKIIIGFLSFGAYDLGANVIGYYRYSLDKFIIGTVSGLEALGIYGTVKTLIFRPAMILIPIINRVTLPLFAGLQFDLTRTRSFYLKSLTLMLLVILPLYMFMVAVGPQLMLIFYGQKFPPIAGVLAAWFAFGLALGMPITTVAPILQAYGKMRAGFMMQLLNLALTPLVVFGGNALWGMVGITIGLALQNVLLVAYCYRLVKPFTGLQFSEFASTIAKPFILTIPGTLGAYGVSQWLTHPWLAVAVGGVVMVVLYSPLVWYGYKPLIKELLTKPQN